jgi:hypothetical protein
LLARSSAFSSATVSKLPWFPNKLVLLRATTEA